LEKFDSPKNETKDTGPVVIREANPQDWVCYHSVINSSSFQKFTVGRKVRYIQESEAEKKWHTKLADKDCSTLVAEMKGAVVGFARIRRHKGISSHVGEVSTVAVLEDFQRRGIGTLLVKNLVHLGFSKLGMKRLQLTVHTDNYAARRLYKKVGFELEGRRMLAIYREDKNIYVSLTLMGMRAS
jgi:putative acetyltransferase